MRELWGQWYGFDPYGIGIVFEFYRLLRKLENILRLFKSSHAKRPCASLCANEKTEHSSVFSFGAQERI
ncbi:MAG: hypothetical protein JWO73_941 [Candidatus Taylorbacteria bacterium]|nr:hypothetical protein [Candidatus Taylorbacteria bacterium]